MSKTIPLTCGFVAIVDDEDFERLSVHKWRANVRRENSIYAMRGNYPNHVYMHREIMAAPPEFQVDHRDRNGLNNQKSNLRLATDQQNKFNRPKLKTSTNRYKGIYFQKRDSTWCARIHYNGRRIHVGVFDSPEKAAKAYDIKAKELFGEFACQNFPDSR